MLLPQENCSADVTGTKADHFIDVGKIEQEDVLQAAWLLHMAVLELVKKSMV